MVLKPLCVPTLGRDLTKTLLIMRSSQRRDPIAPTVKTILLAMKLTAIILLSASLVASANGHGQQVTLSLKNASLETAFKEIKRQTGFSFIYGKEQLADTKQVSITVS